MPWGAAVGAAVGLVGDAMKDDKNGGAGSQTATKEPWAEAAPWLKDLLAQGQSLNNQYTATPFNAQQQQAYGDMANQSAYMQQVVPGLLSQLSGPQVGYDRNNPNARPQAFNFNGLLGNGFGPQSGMPQGGGVPQAGLLSMLGNGGGGAINASTMKMPQAQLPMAPAASAAPSASPETFEPDPYFWMFNGNN